MTEKRNAFELTHRQTREYRTNLKEEEVPKKCVYDYLVKYGRTNI